jgi:AAA domain
MEDVMTKTKNVQRAMQFIDLVQKRDVIRQRGLLLIYGIWGLGKTWFGERFAGENGFIYLRLVQAMSPKDFLWHFLKKLNENLGKSEMPSKKGNNVFDLYLKIKSVINTEFDHPPVFILDEFDYATKRPAILSNVRDLADQTIGTYICIGMQNCYDDIKRAAPYFFNRKMFTLEFKPIPPEDMKKLVKEVSEVNISNENIELLVREGEGNMRRAINLISNAEAINDNEIFGSLLRSKHAQAK